MPGESATQTQHSYPIGPGWAVYRLPFPGTSGVNPRDVGIVFEGEPGDGANPPAGNPPEAPKPPAAPPAPPAPEAPKPPATGDEALGEAGLRALKAERDRADKAEKALAEREAAGQTDHEKAIAKAVKDAEAAKDTEHESFIREERVRSMLRVKGLTNEKALDLAVRAPEFAALKVEKDRSIPDLTKTVDAFVKDYPEMFAAAPAAGDVNRGPNDGSPTKPTTLDGAVAQHYQAQRHQP